MRTRLCKLLLIPAGLLLYYGIVKLTGVGIPCIFHAVTGLNCPGCGVSRMGIALLHLDLRAAYLYNRCVLILSPMIAVLLFRTAYLYVLGKKKGSLEAKLEKYTGLALIVILLAWGVYRNIVHI